MTGGHVAAKPGRDVALSPSSQAEMLPSLQKLSDLHETWSVHLPRGTEQGHRAIFQKYPAVCRFLNR